MPRVVGWHFAVLLIAGLAVTGCHRIQPVYNVQNRSILALSQEQPSLAKIRDAIATAAVNQRLQVVSVGPGAMRATFQWQGHVADTDILYSQQSYSIVLADSSNLKQTDGEIHRNDNRAVRRLRASY